MSGDQQSSDRISLDWSVSERIQELRRSKKWTQEESAERFGLNISTLRRLDQRRQAWSLEQIEQAAAALGVQPRDLLPGGPPPLPTFPALEAAAKAGDAPAALHALADALRNQQPTAPTVDADELRMLEAMRARNPDDMIALVAAFMKKWRLE